MPTVKINGRKVNYSDRGSGLPVIFIPSIVGSKEWFRFQSYGLSDRYRVISYDLSSVRGRRNYSINLLANDLLHFMDYLRIQGAVIAGVDFGALVAIQYALSHPNRCLALVSISGCASYCDVDTGIITRNLFPGEIKFESFLDKIKLFFGQSKSVEIKPKESISYLADNNASLDTKTLYQRLSLMKNTDLIANLAKIDNPSLIIAGSKDIPSILSGSQVMEQQIHDSLLEIIEDADHFCFYKRHDIVNSIISDFISKRLVYI